MDRETVNALDSMFQKYFGAGGYRPGMGGLRGAGSGGAGAAAGDEGQAKAYLERQLNETAASMRSYKSVQQDYSKRQQAGSFAANLFGHTTQAATRNMAHLQRAISQHEQALEELTAQGYTANSVEVKKVNADLKHLRNQEDFVKAQQTGAEVIRSSAAALGQGFLRLYSIQAEYQANLLNVVAQGGSGFQMAAAAMEAAVNKMHAMQSTMAQMAQSAGNSLGQLGGVFAPMAGLALNVYGQAMQAQADAQKLLAQTQIRIMAQEGDKLIKTHHQLTNTGVIFGTGMTGLIEATKGTKLRLEEMSAVIANNRDDFARMGIGMSKATTLIGGVAKLLASSTGQFAKADRQLLALGYSYQEQAELAAETAGMLSRGGRKVSEKQVAEATMEMAKNMRVVGELAGIDVKARKKSIEEEQKKFAINAAMTKLARDDPKRYEQFQAQLKGMTESQRAAAYELQVFGTVRDKDLAIQMALNSGYRKIVLENKAALENGTAGTIQAQSTAAKYAKEETDGYVTMGSTIGKANMALGSFEGVARNATKSLDEAQNLINANVKEAEKNVRALVEKANQPAGTDPTTILLNAQEKAALAAKGLQEKVIDKLPSLSAALTKAFDDAIAALDGKGADSPLGALNKWMPLLIAAMVGLTIVEKLSLLARHKETLMNLKDKVMGPKGPGEKGMLSNLKEKFFPEKKQSSYDKYMDEMNKKNSPTKLQKVTDALGKTGDFVSKHAGKLAVVGNLINVGFAAKAVYDQQAEYEKAKASGDQGGMDAARAEQGKAVGGATGAIIGTALGAIGGPLGMAIGGYLGSEIGGMLGEYAGPYWDTMKSKLGEWGSAVSTGASALWKSASEWASGKWTEASNWVKTSTTEFLAEHPKLAAAVAKFPKSFDEAGKLAKGLLFDTQAKFKSEFPKLYANLESTFKTVGSFMGGIMDSMGKKWTDAKGWIAGKLGLNEAQPATANMANQPTAAPRTPAAAPRTPASTSPPPGATSGFNETDKKNIQSWADGVNTGKYGLDNVPAVYRSEVAKLVKSKPAAKPAAKPADSKPAANQPAASPGTPAERPGSSPPARVTLGSMPGKTALTATEKANAMETVASNTKYTNDLLLASQKNLENLNKIMIQKLEAVVSATEATAGYGKKTARNTS